jgi:hypothetical protein
LHFAVVDERDCSREGNAAVNANQLFAEGHSRWASPLGAGVHDEARN